MVKYFKQILIILVVLIIAFALVQNQNNKVYAKSDPVEYWAVIVGVADYLYFDSSPLFPKPMKGYDLVYSDNDSIELANRLRSIWGADHIKLLVDTQATKSSIQNAITGWLDSKEDENDVVLFYFSGHGQQESNDGYAIWPYNTFSTSDKNEIRDDMLDSWLRCLESSQQVIIIDSCNSGGFIEELYQYGRVILTSCSKNEDSYENSSLGHSIFTYYFLDAFNNLDSVDDNNDNSISIQEVFNWAESKTVSSAKTQLRAQNPKICDCNYEQIGLVNIINNNNQVQPYVVCFITVVTIVFSIIVWNKYQSLKRVVEGMGESVSADIRWAY
ncbi:caspase domain-containing protein [Chloroflexota bacterium]